MFSPPSMNNQKVVHNNGAFIGMNSPPSHYPYHYLHDPTLINTHTLLKPQKYQQQTYISNHSSPWISYTPFDNHQPIITSTNFFNHGFNHYPDLTFPTFTSSLSSPSSTYNLTQQQSTQPTNSTTDFLLNQLLHSQQTTLHNLQTLVHGVSTLNANLTPSNSTNTNSHYNNHTPITISTKLPTQCEGKTVETPQSKVDESTIDHENDIVVDSISQVEEEEKKLVPDLPIHFHPVSEVDGEQKDIVAISEPVSDFVEEQKRHVFEVRKDLDPPSLESDCSNDVGIIATTRRHVKSFSATTTTSPEKTVVHKVTAAAPPSPLSLIVCDPSVLSICIFDPGGDEHELSFPSVISGNGHDTPTPLQMPWDRGKKVPPQCHGISSQHNNFGSESWVELSWAK